MTYLVHFGVKGMRWGVRKTRTTASMKPTKKPRTAAEKAARKHTRNQRLALAGAALLVAGPELMHHSISILNTVAGQKREAAGRKAAQAMFSDSHGIPSYSTINLQFNPGNNTWE